jgi:hypothetical protein
MFRKLKKQAVQKKPSNVDLSSILTGFSGAVAHSVALSDDDQRVFHTPLVVDVPPTKRSRHDPEDDNSPDQLTDWIFGETYKDTLADVDEDGMSSAIEKSAPEIVRVETRRRYLSSVSITILNMFWVNPQS